MVDDDHEVCLCAGEGIHCVGNCSGDHETLENGTQSCDGEKNPIIHFQFTPLHTIIIATCSTYPILYPAECEPNRYGYRCQEVCDCSVNGECDPESGCVCNEGYSGAHCETGVYILCTETAILLGKHVDLVFVLLCFMTLRV